MVGKCRKLAIIGLFVAGFLLFGFTANNELFNSADDQLRSLHIESGADPLKRVEQFVTHPDANLLIPGIILLRCHGEHNAQSYYKSANNTFICNENNLFCHPTGVTVVYSCAFRTAENWESHTMAETKVVQVNAEVLKQLREWAFEQPHHVVCEEVYEIATRVVAMVDEKLPIHGLMRGVLGEIDAAQNKELPQEPGMGLLLEAKAAFYSLPEAERNAIFGGWRMNAPLTPTAEEIDELAGGQRPRGFLKLTDHSADLYGCVEWYWDEASTSRVRLSIVEGTSQEYAIRSVEAMLVMLRERWELMTCPQGGNLSRCQVMVKQGNEKSGLQASNKPQELDGNGDEAGEEQTAGSKSYDGLYA